MLRCAWLLRSLTTTTSGYDYVHNTVFRLCIVDYILVVMASSPLFQFTNAEVPHLDTRSLIINIAHPLTQRNLPMLNGRLMSYCSAQVLYNTGTIIALSITYCLFATDSGTRSHVHDVFFFIRVCHNRSRGYLCLSPLTYLVLSI
jgi:hypothetical protein